MNYSNRHIHVSLMNKDGNNVFAVKADAAKTGRPHAAFDDTKFMSQEGEWFLAGVLDGLADGRFFIKTLRYCQAHVRSMTVMPMVCQRSSTYINV